MSKAHIHPTALIEAGAEVASDVEVGAFCYIGAQVRLGPGCRVHHHASIEGNLAMGSGCEVFPYAFLGGRTQDKKWNGEHAPIEIGENNTFREFTTLHPATFGDRKTTIGNGNLFCAYSHIGHECHVGSGCVFSNNATLGGHVLVGDYVVIGGLTAVHQFCHIGSGAMIGGCCKLLQDVMPHMLAEGYPARHKTINKVGLRRAGWSEDDIQVVARIFRLVFRGGLNRPQAIEQLRKGVLGRHSFVEEAVTFLDNSARGLA